MLEYLILNGKFEAAKHYNDKALTTLREELLNHFNKGNRAEFMELFNMLHKQSKLEFYIRVYFLVYSIHPAIRGKGSIPEPQKIAFKDYLDNKGAQLAKTNQFLQFYALPFIKKPLQHLAFKNLFKKQWITNLKQKLQIYINQEQRILKTQINKLFDHSTYSSSADTRVMQQNVKQMQKINKKLFQEVKQFTQKYQILEQNHKAMREGLHSHLLQSQSKWFQITKQLVDCSKTLINMLIQSNSIFLSDKKFIKIKKRTEKYDRFVHKKLDDLINYEQDISIFDKPSINDLSYSITPHTQKSILANHFNPQSVIQRYIPTDYTELKKQFKKLGNQEKIAIINGLYWRVLKSKQKTVRKLNIIGILQYDILGIKSGQIQQMLISRQLMKPLVRLLQLISLDNNGKKILFNRNNLHRDLIGLISQCQDTSCIQYIVSAIGQISSQRYFKHDLINLDIIEICMGILRSNKYQDSEMMLQNTVAILLNMLQKDEGLRKFEKQRDVFDILKRYTKNKYKITRALIYGIIFALLESQVLFKKAQRQKLPEFFDNIQNIDPTINKTQLKYLRQRLTVYQPKQPQAETVNNDSQQEQQEQPDFQIDDYIPQLDQMMKFHEQLIQKYSLKGRQATKQTQQIKQLLQSYKHTKLPQFKNLDQQNKNIYKINSPVVKPKQMSIQTPYIKQLPKLEQPAPSQRPQKKLNNYFQNPTNKNADKQKPKKDKNAEKIRQQIENSQRNEERRMQKSISADRGIGNQNERNQKFIYQSNRFANDKVSQFKANEQKSYRSPQHNKRSREEVLKQLNEQIKADEIMRSKKKNNNESKRQNYVTSYQSQRQRKGQDQGGVFQSRPKLRRTPPKQ